MDQQAVAAVAQLVIDSSLVLGLVGGVLGAAAYDLARTLIAREAARRSDPTHQQPQR